jgi:hypothetical protein
MKLSQVKEPTITARWLKDVVPPEVYRDHVLWELSRLVYRLRDAGVSANEIDAVYPMNISREDYNSIILDDTSPLERYFLGLTPYKFSAIEAKRRLTEEIEASLNDETKVAAAVADIKQKLKAIREQPKPERPKRKKAR